MALDLYAGPLTRYFCGEWENIMARTFRERGMKYQVARPGGDKEEEGIDPNSVANHVAGWAALITRSLGDHLSSPIAWEDTISGVYETDRPHWQGYSALLLTAAHVEQPQYELPATAPEQWADHPAFIAATAKEAKSRFTQILLPELWLPADFAFAFQAPGPGNGQPTWIGSVSDLRMQLTKLNEEFFHASDDDLLQWCRTGMPEDNSFKECAQYCFAVFYRLASFADTNRLPLKLDY